MKEQGKGGGGRKKEGSLGLVRSDLENFPKVLKVTPILTSRPPPLTRTGAGGLVLQQKQKGKKSYSKKVCLKVREGPGVSLIVLDEKKSTCLSSTKASVVRYSLVFSPSFIIIDLGQFSFTEITIFNSEGGGGYRGRMGIRK